MWVVEKDYKVKCATDPLPNLMALLIPTNRTQVQWTSPCFIYNGLSIRRQPMQPLSMGMEKARTFPSKCLPLLTFTCICICSLPIHGQPFDRRQFPPQFIFGTSSSSYQYEGAFAEGGRLPSIWDTFSHIPGNVIDGSNGDIAVDQYHLYPGDVEAMSNLGMDAYRLSISWSRLIPKGRGRLNPEGVAHYNNFINDLLRHGIEPFVAITHFDIPQALQDEYGGWLSPRIVNDFADYAEACFEAFGDRVKHWVTMNEPNLYAQVGYGNGVFPPARCSPWVGNCTAGDSTVEPYIAVHYQILSHVAAVQRYQKFRAKQNGSIGIIISAQWYEPLRDTAEDRAAVDRNLEFTVGWILDPLYFGHYPASMRAIVRSRLPNFTLGESARMKGTLDFIGINHYTTNYVFDAPRAPTPQSYLDDIGAKRTGYRDGVLIGPMGGMQTDTQMDFIVPRGIKAIVEYITHRYSGPVIFITENGLSQKKKQKSNFATLETILNDTARVQYHHDYLQQLLLAIREGANVRGYFVWTLMDDFEFRMGFTLKYGLLYVDLNDGLKRYPKASALWFKTFLNPKTQDEGKENTPKPHMAW